MARGSPRGGDLKSKVQRIADDLTMLDLTPAQVAAQPEITPTLRRAKLLPMVVEYLRGSADPDAKRYLGVWDGLTKRSQADLSIEVVATASGLSTERLFELIAGEVFRQAKYEGALLAAAAHPKVVAKSIERALEEPITVTNSDGTQTTLAAECGVADRKMLHQQAGFLPMPKTQFVSLPGVKSIDARTQTQNVTVLPSVESSVKRMADRFGEKLLGPAPEVPEVELEDSQDDEGEDD